MPSHPRASGLDPIARQFAERGVEPNLDDLRGLLPPLRYVNADFKVYPLVLGEKDGPSKVRLVADGSELHLGIVKEERPCGTDMRDAWFGPAFRARFCAGADGAPPAGDPTWLEGFLPVACFQWERHDARYTLEVFAALLPHTSQRLCAWLRMGAERLRPRAPAQWRLELKGDAPLAAGDGFLYHPASPGNLLRGGFSDEWRFDPATQSLVWSLRGSTSGRAHVVLLDQPAESALIEPPSTDFGPYGIDRSMTEDDSGRYLRDMCEAPAWERRMTDYLAGWRRRLDAGAQADVPEDYVNHAHRAVRVGSWMIAHRDQMTYSAHNHYERLYTDECAHASLGLAYWGHLADAARYLGHVAFYTQASVTAHDLGNRLHYFCRYVELSGDAEFLERNRPRMRRWAQWLMDDVRDARRGLGSPTGYAGDLQHVKVQSLAANSVAWRGLRDFARLTGDEPMLARAERHRQAIRRAADATLDAKSDPHFMSLCLYGNEPTPRSLLDTSLSSYWCLLAPYALYSNALGDAHPGTRAMIDTFRRRDGLYAGLVRFAWHGEFGDIPSAEEMGLDDLYGAKLCEAFARLDSPDDLVLALYGKLAVGLTPDTFVGGETSSIVTSRIHGPDVPPGRSLGMPPNTTSQMFLATLLRHMLVFDFDSLEDGRTDTLRLAFSTPRAWLDEGKEIVVRDMPTAFGTVGYALTSRITSRKSIDARVSLPERRAPESVHLRLRVPAAPGRRLRAVTVNGRMHPRFDPATETIDLSGLAGDVALRAQFA